MLILYRERDLDEAYRIDCRARTKGNEPWIKREDFRHIYEALLDTYFTKSIENKLEKKEQDVANRANNSFKVFCLYSKFQNNSLYI